MNEGHIIWVLRLNIANDITITTPLHPTYIIIIIIIIIMEVIISH